MTDEPRDNASGADAWLPEEHSAQSAYEGRQPPDRSETPDGTRVGRDAPPTGGGGPTSSQSSPAGSRDRDDETVREGGGAPRERE